MGCAMRKGCMLYLLLLCLFFSVTASAAEIRVPTDFPTIQNAIDAALAGDTIKVAEGIYRENLLLIGTVNISLQGGYTLDFSSRDPLKHVSKIDGGGFDSTVIFFGSTGSTIDGFTITNGQAVDWGWDKGYGGGGIACYYAAPVISNNIVTKNRTVSSGIVGTGMGGGIYAIYSTPRIINNTITLNETSGSDTSGGGGGIALNSTYPETEIRDNTINSNQTTFTGGGIQCLISDAEISDNSISKNIAGVHGGGIYILSGSPHIINNIITANQATDKGGGIASDISSGIFEENDISDNKAEFGGGIFCNGPENSPLFHKNSITGNQADDGGGVGFMEADGDFIGNVVKGNNAVHGGGIYCDGLTPAISNSVIAKNYAEQGGGILCTGSSPTVANSIIAGNVAANYGAAMHCDIKEENDPPDTIILSSPIVTNCTFVRNHAKQYGTIYLTSSSHPQISNSIFWENHGDIIPDTTSQPVFEYTLIRDPRYKGINGNISQNPLFVNLDTGDYALKPESPCMDTGDPSLSANDPDSTRNDMGAFGGPGAADWAGIQPLVPVPEIEDDAWNNIGPYGGHVTSIAINPMNPAKMFATAYQGDGLFVSQNQGTTWKPVPGFRNYDNRQVVVDQNNSSRVWSVYATLIARSDDSGSTWSRWRLSDTRHAFSIAVHPTNSQIVYVATSGTFNSTVNGTVFKTIDGGSTWQQTTLAADKAVTALEISPSNPEEIWVVTGWSESGSVYKSENGGAEWSKVDIGVEGKKVHQIVIAPGNPMILYLSGSFGILKSTDGGLNWEGAGVTDSCRALALDPVYPDIVFAATTFESEPALFKSENAGASWDKYSLAGIGRLLTLTINPDNSGKMIAGSYNSGIYTSGDGGQTWQDSGQGITANIVYDSYVDPRAHMEFIAGTESGVFRRNSKNNWHRLTQHSSYALAHAPHDSRIIYSGQYYNLAKSIDGGSSWTETEILDSRNEITSVSSIAIDPVNNYVLYIGVHYSTGNKGEVYKSVDGGQTLTPMMELSVPINTVAIDPSDSSVIYAGSGSFYASAFDREGGVYRSNDTGITWSDSLLSEVVVNAIRVDPGNTDIVYAACGDSGLSFRGLYKSMDGGQSWQDKTFVADAVRDITIDPQNTDKIYAATYNYGIFLSIDGGENWTNIGLSNYVVNDVTYHRIAGAQAMHRSTGSGGTAEENTGLVYAGTNSGVTGYTGSTIYGMIYKGDTTEVAYPAEAWLDVGLGTPFRALIWDSGHYLIAKPPVGDDFTLNCETNGFYDQITNIRVWPMAELNYDFHLKPGSLPSPGIDNNGSGGGGGCFIDSLR